MHFGDLLSQGSLKRRVAKEATKPWSYTRFLFNAGSGSGGTEKGVVVWPMKTERPGGLGVDVQPAMPASA